MGLPDLLGLCTWILHHVPDFHLTFEWKANVCVESMSLVLTPDSHALNGFHFIVCVSREHMCLSASALASFVLSPLQASSQDLLVLLQPGLVHS